MHQLSFKDLHDRYGPDCHRSPNRRYWDATLRMSDRALGQFHRVLIKYHGQLHSTLVLRATQTCSPGRLVVDYRISLPARCHWDFCRDAGVALRHPPKVSLGIGPAERPGERGVADAWREKFKRSREAGRQPGRMVRCYYPHDRPGQPPYVVLRDRETKASSVVLEGAEVVKALLDGQMDELLKNEAKLR